MKDEGTSADFDGPCLLWFLAGCFVVRLFMELDAWKNERRVRLVKRVGGCVNERPGSDMDRSDPTATGRKEEERFDVRVGRKEKKRSRKQRRERKQTRVRVDLRKV